MTHIDGVIFIDANQYLELYRTVSGKKLLGVLREQKDYIFVPRQVVDEVRRNKVEVAATFLTELFSDLELRNFTVPDHLFGTTGGRASQVNKQFKDIREKMKNACEELEKLAGDILVEISRSEDMLSKVLAEIFSKAVSCTSEELQRAKLRKEFGNAPGKKADPLGDQVIWEQILSHCKGKRRWWIITGDSDYATKYGNKRILNASLQEEIIELCQPVPEVYCFGNIPDGISHFVETTRVKADKLPTAKELEQIKKEQEALPPISLLSSNVSVSTATSANVSVQQQNRNMIAAYLAALRIPVSLSSVFPPPETGELTKDPKDEEE